MLSISRFALLAGVLALAGCDRQAQPEKRTLPKIVTTDPASPVPPVAPPPSPPSRAADQSPTLVPEAEKGEKGARGLLLDWARAIELKRFDEAWAMLSAADREKWSRAAFTRIFAGLGTIAVAVPGGELEGAAGSLYYTAPVTITANDRDGRPVRIEGEAILRRVNDVDGATPAQLRWHFERVTLSATH